MIVDLNEGEKDGASLMLLASLVLEEDDDSGPGKTAANTRVRLRQAKDTKSGVNRPSSVKKCQQGCDYVAANNGRLKQHHERHLTRLNPSSPLRAQTILIASIIILNHPKLL